MPDALFYANFMLYIWIYCIAEDGDHYVRMIFGNVLSLAKDKDRLFKPAIKNSCKPKKMFYNRTYVRLLSP